MVPHEGALMHRLAVHYHRCPDLPSLDRKEASSVVTQQTKLADAKRYMQSCQILQGSPEHVFF